MSFQITAIPQPTAPLSFNVFTLSANETNVAWMPIRDDGYGTYVVDTSLASASYFNTSCGSFDWTVSNTCSTLSVSSLTDTQSIYISAVNSAFNGATAVFNPYYINLSSIRTSITGISLTAFYQQVSTYNTANLVGNKNYALAASPTAGVSAIFVGFPSTVYNFSNGYVSMLGQNCSAVNLSSVQLNQTYALSFYPTDDAYALNSDLSDVRTIATASFLTNPLIEVNTITQTNSTIQLNVTQDGDFLKGNTPLLWTITPNTGLTALTAQDIPTNVYIADGTYVGGASALSSLFVTVTALTETYQITLSSYTGAITTQFRPYIDLTTGSYITAVATPIANDGSSRRYSARVYGNTNNILHNLNPDLYLYWQNNNNTPTVRGYTLSTNREYIFGDTPENSFDSAINIDSLLLTFNTDIVYQSPEIVPYSIQIYASPTNDILQSVGDTTLFFNIFEWLDESVYYPSFRVQYEPESLTNIYRPFTTGVYTISNTSILYPNTTGYMRFSFSTGTSTLSFDTANNDIPTGIYLPIGAGAYAVSTVSLSISSYAAGYPDYYIRSTADFSEDRNIVFTEFPAANKLAVWPVYTWSGTDWIPGSIGTPATGYGICHTEYFTLCSGATGTNYRWIYQDTNYITTSTVSSISAGLRGSTLTTTIPVTVGVYTSVLPVDMPGRYYDTPTGTAYPNFVVSSIPLYGLDYLGLYPRLTATPDSGNIAAPANLVLSGFFSLTGSTSIIPFSARNNGFYWLVSSPHWANIEYVTVNGTTTAFSTNLSINVDDIGATFLYVPKFRVTPISIIPVAASQLILKKPYPLSDDWCLENTVSGQSVFSYNCYPVTPGVYTTTTHSTTGTSIQFENITPYASNVVSAYSWFDRDIQYNRFTNSSFVTSFSADDEYSIQLSTTYKDFKGLTSTTDIADFVNIVNIDKEYLTRDSNITRIISATQLELPYRLDQCQISPNEWLTHETFNYSINRLYDNLQYLENMCTVYDAPPIDYVGWLGTLLYGNNVPVFRWYPNMTGVNYLYDQPRFAVDDKFTTLQDIYAASDKLLVSNGTTIYMLSTDYNATQLTSRSYKVLGDDFSFVRAVQIVGEKIFILDSNNPSDSSIVSKNRVLVMSYDAANNFWKNLYDWGGYGGAQARYKFRNPSDMVIDNEYIWITDTDNLCIKKFAQTGTWVKTLTSSAFTEDAKPISTVIDTDNNIQVLLNNNTLVRVDQSGVVLNTVELSCDGVPAKLEKCQDAGFFYVACSDRVIKLQNDGSTAGDFGFDEFFEYVQDYRSIFHDSNRNLYLVSNNNILKYIDKLVEVTCKQDTYSNGWPLNALRVNKEEFIQDWIVNKCFQRFWDNLELFRRSLLGKFTYVTKQNSTTITGIFPVLPPTDFDFCKYDYFGDAPVVRTVTYTHNMIKPTIRIFTPDEYSTFTYPKSSVYVGLNEYVTADVLNRCITKLYNCQETLLQMIRDT